MKEEVFKDIPGYEGLYQVSNLGRVKSLNYLGHKGVEKVLKYANRRGYIVVRLSKNKKGKDFGVHRLVYMAFKGPIPEGLEVNHIDEDKINNKPENLNLMTRKDNNNWASGNERRSKTLTNRKDKSKPVLQYDLNNNFIKEWISIHEIERTLKIASSNICKCLKHERKSTGGYIWKYKEAD